MAQGFENFTILFLKLTRYWNNVASEELKKYDIKAAYGVYLMILNDSEEELTAGKLSKIAKRDKADVSRAMDLFLTNGLIKLKGETNYRAIIKLTPKGKKLLEKINTKLTTFIDELSEGVSEEQRKAFEEAFTLMSKNLKEKYEDK